MSWVRIDDHATEHPKMLEAGMKACALWLSCLCYCSRELTDGFVTVSAMRKMGGRAWKVLAQRLLDVRLLECDGEDYRVHQYLDYQLSAEEVRRQRDRKYEAKRNRRARTHGAGGTLSRVEWSAIVARHDGRCVYCGQALPDLTQDHAIPLSRGGRHEGSNVVPACRSCNSRKHTKTADEFRSAHGPS